MTSGSHGGGQGERTRGLQSQSLRRQWCCWPKSNGWSDTRQRRECWVIIQTSRLARLKYSLDLEETPLYDAVGSWRRFFSAGRNFYLTVSIADKLMVIRSWVFGKHFLQNVLSEPVFQGKQPALFVVIVKLELASKNEDSGKPACVTVSLIASESFTNRHQGNVI